MIHARLLAAALVAALATRPVASLAEDAHDERHVDEVRLTAEAVEANGIRVATVRPVAMTPTIEAPARVAFNDEAVAHVGSPVAGRAVRVHATFGGKVKQGDALLVVESPELGAAQSDLLQRRTAESVARATTRPARESLDRAEALYAHDEGIALAEVQRRRADLAAAEGAVQTAHAAAVAAEVRLRLFGMGRAAIETLIGSGEIDPRFTVDAPIGGTVTARDVTQGELVGPERDAVFVIADTSTLWVWADVPEAQLAAVGVGARATVRTSGDAARPIEARVSLVAPQVSEETRTARVRVDVANADGRLRPGMFARVEIAGPADGRTADAVLAVPASAVLTVEGGPAVFVPVEGEANTFAKRDVRLGATAGGRVAILSGLADGERYVAEGAFVLKADLGKAGAAHEH